MANSVSWILVTSPLLWWLFASSFAAGATKQRGVPKEHRRRDHESTGNVPVDLADRDLSCGASERRDCDKKDVSADPVGIARCGTLPQGRRANDKYR
jgi:hypothetical protein